MLDTREGGSIPPKLIQGDLMYKVEIKILEYYSAKDIHVVSSEILRKFDTEYSAVQRIVIDDITDNQRHLTVVNIEVDEVRRMKKEIKMLEAEVKKIEELRALKIEDAYLKKAGGTKPK